MEVEFAAGVGLVVAGNDLDQRRFAGAVVAQQTDHLTRVNLKIDIVQGFYFAK